MKVFIFVTLVLSASYGQVTKTYKNYIASWSSDSQQILFYSDRNGNWDIFSIKPDGSALRQIPYTSFNEREPNWHPEKNAYAFSSDSLGERRIFIHDFDSNGRMKLTNDAGQHASPSWSPDGKHLAYLSEENKQWKVFIMTMKDATVRAVYTGDIYPGRPTWSPSGKEVIYSIAVNGKETLHLVRLDGTIAKTYITGYNSCGNAALSPDGAYIVFDAHSDDILDSGDGKWEIYKLNIADHSIIRLTNNASDDWGPRWSPDGTKISFLGAGLNNTGYELFVMNADGTGKKQLTSK
jgi:Tol biopolymer transport system component